MRPRKTLIAFLVLITASFCSLAQAQSGSRSVVASPSAVAPTFSTPLGAPAFDAGPVVQQGFSAAPVAASPGSYGVGGTTFGGTNYGPATISNSVGQSSGQCCNHCQITPSQVYLKPVQSCCGQLGPLGIPPLTTPPRSYLPPIGKSVGRPLFGRWSGF